MTEIIVIELAVIIAMLIALAVQIGAIGDLMNKEGKK